MVSNKAEERRQRFLKIKEEFTDTNDLIRSMTERDVNIYIDKKGNILSASHGDMGHIENDNIKKIIFTKEQAGILKNADLSKYMIVTDPIHDTVHTIQVKQVEERYTKTTDFLEKIEKSKSKSYDISVNLKNKLLNIKLSKKNKKKYEGVETHKASINSIRQFTFYITAENDPHYMYHTCRVSLKDLLENDVVELPLPAELTHCDVYTMKIYDKYVRT
jgi:hypothetical protein|tara:strand:- start:26 stop:679 length:654 start_codon:yes stop_codon:yes gene_type:complete